MVNFMKSMVMTTFRPGLSWPFGECSFSLRDFRMGKEWKEAEKESKGKEGRRKEWKEGWRERDWGIEEKSRAEGPRDSVLVGVLSVTLSGCPVDWCSPPRPPAPPAPAEAS